MRQKPGNLHYMFLQAYVNVSITSMPSPGNAFDKSCKFLVQLPIVAKSENRRLVPQLPRIP